MVLTRFRIIILLQIVLLALVPAVFFYLYKQPGLLFTKMFLVLLWLGLIFNLLFFITRHLRELKLFLSAFQHLDTSIRFSEHEKDPDFSGLHQEFNRIVNSFAIAREERQIQQLYLQSAIENIKVGIIAFDASGEVKLINQAGKDLLGITVLRNVNQLASVDQAMVEKLRGIKPGQEMLVKIKKDKEILPISLRATQFLIKQKSLITLISLQSIKAEIATTEMEAWQKLIQVLRHEIMNSLGSINLLAGSMIKLQHQSKILEKNEAIFSELHQDLNDGLIAIQNRSSGLINFVQKYRKVSNIPAPEFSLFSLKDFMQNMYQLVKVQVEKSQVNYEWKIVPEDLQLFSDKKLLEQVMLNLVNNSVEALKTVQQKRILIEWVRDDSQVTCRISDNGTGIEKQNLERIFIPFFTTKKQGSGIGLAVSSRIMNQLQGDISVSSGDNSTIFKLSFYIN